jgi:hypothetical protein
MLEPDVTLTDYGLAIESALFSLSLYRRGEGPHRIGFLLFFGSLAVAALAGGTVHGFFPDEASLGYSVLWTTSLLALGVTATAAWMIGVRLLFTERIVRRVSTLAALAALVYSFAVLFVTQDFLVALIGYLPATLFLLVCYPIAYRRKGEPTLLAGQVGLLLTLVAAAIQWGRISLHPFYFNHNAFYHLIQAIALLLIYWSARWLTGVRSAFGRSGK